MGTQPRVSGGHSFGHAESWTLTSEGLVSCQHLTEVRGRALDDVSYALTTCDKTPILLPQASVRSALRHCIHRLLVAARDHTSCDDMPEYHRAELLDTADIMLYPRMRVLQTSLCAGL